MKRTLLSLAALIMIVLSVNAQSKEQVLKALEKAKVTAENPKKASNPNTWIKLANAYTAVYEAPRSGVSVGYSQMETKLILKDQKILSSTQKVIGDVQYTVDTFDNKVLYYNPTGVLEIIEITNPYSDENLLDLAYDALMKANEVDAKGSKKEDIALALNMLKQKYIDEAMSANALGDIKKANQFFEASLKTSENPVVNAVDTLINYYTAYTYNMLNDTENARKYYEKCLNLGYYSEGSVLSALAEIAKSKGDFDLAKEYLNKGFQLFPTSQYILISLINLYTETNDDPNKILALIKSAQENEPNNGSLYYAEGNVYKNLKNIDEAIKCYYKAYEVDPNYIFGIYSVANTYFDLAIEAQTAINELDVNDIAGYEKLYAEFEDNLIKAIEPFEQAFVAATNINDKEFQIAIADGLKQIYFRFRDKDESYLAGFEKYNTFLQENDTK